MLRRAAAASAPVLPAFVTVALMILWAAHDGGYDQDTWYWGALVVLGSLAAIGMTLPRSWTRLDGAQKVAILSFAAYAAWSYLSITWASSPGDALAGSNRTLLYLLVFTVFALTVWTTGRAMTVLLVYALGVGAIAGVILLSMATRHHPATLFSEGRLVSPTGYFNSTAALFTMAALVAAPLAARRELPSVVRALLLAVACAGIQLALLAQSRGWLFTLPLILGLSMVVVRDRLRVVVAAVVPIVGALVALPQLLDVFRATDGPHPSSAALVRAAEHAGRTGLLICVAVFVAALLLATVDRRRRAGSLSVRWRRLIGAIVAAAALAGALAGGVVATHGHPVAFVKRQWRGFTNPTEAILNSSSSHFATVGSGRYDAWRVALDALATHPVGGLGQDNYADYYIRHRHTGEELMWTHSLEFRVLAHTGVVGALLFGTFLVGALIAALRTRRRASPLPSALAGAAVLPLLVWLVHGSLDWFWEVPALSAPALAFLSMAGRIDRSEPVAAAGEQTGEGQSEEKRRRRLPTLPRAALGGLGLVAVTAATATLGFPYLSAREVSLANSIRSRNPAAALRDLARAANLNPLAAEPGRVAGTIALQSGSFIVAEQRFRQATEREPGGWYGWLGAGLAASALGDSALAERDYRVALSINSRDDVIRAALARVNSTHPITPGQALRMITIVG